MLSSFLIHLTVHTCQSDGRNPQLLVLHCCVLVREVITQLMACHEELASA